MENAKKVYVLESRHHGSNQQLLAVAQYIYGNYDLVSRRVELRSRSKFFCALCRAAIFFMSNLKNRTIRGLISWLLLKNGGLKIRGTDVIIAKTPPFEYPAALLSVGTKAKVVFIGAPKNFPKDYFDIIVSTPSTFCSKADIFLETLPTALYHGPNFNDFMVKKDSSVWALILGGDARGYSYNSMFYDSLCKEMLRISGSLGIKWIISSSPRTGYMAEKIIGEFASKYPKRIEKCVMWGSGDRFPLGEIFKRSSIVLITEDSASMISEAVNYRARTICIRPEFVQYNGLVTPLLNELERKQRILRLSLSEMSDLSVEEIKNFKFQALQENWVETWKRQAGC